MPPILTPEDSPRETSEQQESSRGGSSSIPVTPTLNISAPVYFPKGGISDSSSTSQWIPCPGEFRSLYWPPHSHVRFNQYGVPPMLPCPHLHCLPPFAWPPHQIHNPHIMELSQWDPFTCMDYETGRLCPRFPQPDLGLPVNISPVVHDNHRDLRLDVDSMSYEELLALGERMGSVSLGAEEKKMDSIVRRKVCCCDDGEKEMCCVCQEDAEEGDEMGVLECGHGFHVDCIKQWLRVNNVCPICKNNALAS